jgi:hypothetical protein
MIISVSAPTRIIFFQRYRKFAQFLATLAPEDVDGTKLLDTLKDNG